MLSVSALQLVIQPQVRPSVFEQSHTLTVGHALGQVQRRVVGAVAGVHAGAALEEVAQDEGLRADGREVEHRVAGVTRPLEQLVVR